MTMIAKTCINCGAPLTGNKCEYCGTEYGEHGFIGDIEAYSGEITVNGQTLRCYIGQIETLPIHSTDFGRTADGTLVANPVAVKRKLTLIEY